ncbi:MAG: hypothetical protein ACPLRZ_09260 [Thermovenabulum sp.]|uniref:hypothetical protein n=1 Tax=Thermovenabulum sp. TaxID=3100335 RepID=UPI003C7EA77B
MKVPEKTDFTQISECPYLKCEETCYGITCYCLLGAEGKKEACSAEVKKACEEEHQYTV